ncbi:cupin domain-containing protein [Paracoccidioides lutzii Pb01]|uniref:Cupin domain-containing protein n=1 Tax=Paracoccidioides lutzii (strain ATCC MYA-826 / Pb01) TaxID=502779 RepID=C1GPT7_PARBA|nr:cupin domain-containing protein [Paracoccidioides lutzii Pb01]EEH36209.1 cupin domain-containing protein [Paracoccidioides lutzii Pb01]
MPPAVKPTLRSPNNPPTNFTVASNQPPSNLNRRRGIPMDLLHASLQPLPLQQPAKITPERFEAVVSKEDVLVVPARAVLGRWSVSMEWDMCYRMGEEGDKAVGIGKVGWFEKDPVYGDKGPVFDV